MNGAPHTYVTSGCLRHPGQRVSPIVGAQGSHLGAFCSPALFLGSDVVNLQTRAAVVANLSAGHHPASIDGGQSLLRAVRQEQVVAPVGASSAAHASSHSSEKQSDHAMSSSSVKVLTARSVTVVT
jgi:hypothetical protein